MQETLTLLTETFIQAHKSLDVALLIAPKNCETGCFLRLKELDHAIDLTTKMTSEDEKNILKVAKFGNITVKQPCVRSMCCIDHNLNLNS